MEVVVLLENVEEVEGVSTGLAAAGIRVTETRGVSGAMGDEAVTVDDVVCIGTTVLL